METQLEGRYAGSAGGQIYWRRWLPSGDPAAVVVIAHGYAEHSGRYAHVAARLTAAGYAVYALDHRGHGRSDGHRANLDRMAHVRADLHELVSLARAHHPRLSVFLLGHSLGSVIVLDYVVSGRDGLAGLVLSGTAVDPSSVNAVEKAAARLLSFMAPNAGVARLDVKAVSRDPEVVARYEADPLNYHGKVRARTGAEILAAIDRVAGGLQDVELPLLLMHGGDDLLASPEGARVVAARVSSTDVTLQMYDGLYHEIFNEPEQHQVLDDLVAWFDQRTAEAQA